MTFQLAHRKLIWTRASLLHTCHRLHVCLSCFQVCFGARTTLLTNHAIANGNPTAADTMVLPDGQVDHATIHTTIGSSFITDNRKVSEGRAQRIYVCFTPPTVRTKLTAVPSPALAGSALSLAMIITMSPPSSGHVNVLPALQLVRPPATSPSSPTHPCPPPSSSTI